MPLVLVVAPQGEEQEKLCKEIEVLGYETRHIEPGIDAVTAVISESPDLVIMVQNLPELDALETLRMVREFDTEIPVFIISNVVKKENVLEAKKYAVTEFLVLPIDYPALRGRVVKYVPMPTEKDHEALGEDEEGGEPKGIKSLAIGDLTLGVKVARPIMIEQNVILPENVILNEHHIQKLKKWGIEKIEVFSATIDSSRRVEIKDVDDSFYKGESIPIDRGKQYITLGQLVDVVSFDVGGAREYLGSVDDIKSNFFVVGLPSSSTRPMGISQGTSVTVKYGYRGAKIEFTSNVVKVERGRETNIILSYPRTLFRKQMRKNVRVPVNYPVSYKIVTDSGEEKPPIDAIINDISAGGMGILTKEFIRKGMTVLSTFKLNDELDFTDLRGTFVRAGEAKFNKEYKFGGGIVFTSLTDFHKEKLVKFIFDLQRDAKQSKRPGILNRPGR